MRFESSPPVRKEPEPRWQALIAIVALGGLYLALPGYLTIGPRWVVPAIVGVLVIPLVVSHQTGRHRIDIALGFTVTTIVTIALILSVALLITAPATYVAMRRRSTAWFSRH